MPTTLAEVLSCSPHLQGPVRWGKDPKCRQPGVYIVCLPSTTNQAPIDVDVLRYWVQNARGVTVRNAAATPAVIAQVLCRFWHGDEMILYIGSTGANSNRSISERVFDFYGTPIGFGRPHRGGYWIKTLSCINYLNVYWSPCDDPEAAERDLQELFIGHRNGSTSTDLPFANLERKLDGSWKPHGISKAEFE